MILTILFWAMVVLFVATAIFYIVFFSLIYYWHVTKVTVVIVPLLFTFEFFLTLFLIVSLLVIVINYTPDIVQMLSK